MSLGQENSVVFLHGVDVWLHPGMTEFQVAFQDAAVNYVKWQRFSEVLPSPVGYIYHSCMKIAQAMPHEGSKVKHLQQWFLALPFMQWDFSEFPESFHNIMHSRWWKTKIILQSWVEQCSFLTEWQCSHEVYHKGVSHDPFLLSKTELLVNLDTLPCWL